MWLNNDLVSVKEGTEKGGKLLMTMMTVGMIISQKINDLIIEMFEDYESGERRRRRGRYRASDEDDDEPRYRGNDDDDDDY